MNRREKQRNFPPRKFRHPSDDGQYYHPCGSYSRSHSFCPSSQKHHHGKQQLQHTSARQSRQFHPYYNHPGYRQGPRRSQKFNELPSEEVVANHVEISKELVRILRHGKYKFLNDVMSTDGYVDVEAILQDRKFIKACGELSVKDIIYIVESNDKQRFTLKRSGSQLVIAAAQGHTIQIQSLDLTPLCNPHRYRHVYHGTYYHAWEEIKFTGLSRMNRNHIHFATGLPRDRHVQSGMRQDIEVVIELNMEYALRVGLKFFVSSNGVILSEGDCNGIIHPKFFKKVFQIKPFYHPISFTVPRDDQHSSFGFILK